MAVAADHRNAGHLGALQLLRRHRQRLLHAGGHLVAVAGDEVDVVSSCPQHQEQPVGGRLLGVLTRPVAVEHRRDRHRRALEALLEPGQPGLGRGAGGLSLDAQDGSAAREEGAELAGLDGADLTLIRHHDEQGDHAIEGGLQHGHDHEPARAAGIGTMQPPEELLELGHHAVARRVGHEVQPGPRRRARHVVAHHLLVLVRHVGEEEGNHRARRRRHRDASSFRLSRRPASAKGSEAGSRASSVRASSTRPCPTRARAR